MSLSAYKIIHYLGLMTLFLGFGGLILGALIANGREFAHRRIFTTFHGVGLMLIFVSGFGQLARLGMTSSWPAWVWVKLVVWLALGAVLTLILRRPKKNLPLAVILILLGAVAAYLGHFKPLLFN